MCATKFGGHEGFPLRPTWPIKAVRAVAHDPRVFTKPDAIVTFGVGKNMVSAIRYWSLALGLATQSEGRGEFAVTPLGTALFGTDDSYDPYCIKAETAWVLHYMLVASHATPNAFGRFWASFPEPEFVSAQLSQWLTHYETEHGVVRMPATTTIARDVEMLVRMYSAADASLKPSTSTDGAYESPLADLGLLRQVDRQRTRVVRTASNPPPDALLAFAIEAFWRTYDSASPTLSFEHVAYGEGSPGRIFCLSPQTTAEAIERISREFRSVQYDETAGMRTLHRGPEFGERGTDLADWLHYVYSPLTISEPSHA